MAGGTLAGGTSDLAARPALVPASAGARCSPGETGMTVPQALRLDGPPLLPGISKHKLEIKIYINLYTMYTVALYKMQCYTVQKTTMLYTCTKLCYFGL